LDRVALEFPELCILAGHIGVPWLGEMLSLVMKYTNEFIDTSAYKVTRYPKDLLDYMHRSSRHQVLFGSNHPFWPASECLAGFDKLGLSKKAATLFLADNAKNVFKLN
jgi:predicted TIM-barrel fold metal-dependent hydrolase